MCTVVPQTHPSEFHPATMRWEVINQIFTEYKRTHNVCTSLEGLPDVQVHHVPMSDGVMLWTLVINPGPAGTRRGTVLTRSPYGPTSQNVADIFVATNKYVAVLQDDRGTWRSNGTYDMWQTSIEDGQSPSTHLFHLFAFQLSAVSSFA